jgi:hypothetical protein
MGKIPKGVSGRSIGNKNNTKRGRGLNFGGKPPKKGCALFLIALAGISTGVIALGYVIAQHFIA